MLEIQGEPEDIAKEKLRIDAKKVSRRCKISLINFKLNPFQ